MDKSSLLKVHTIFKKIVHLSTKSLVNLVCLNIFQICCLGTYQQDNTNCNKWSLFNEMV